MLPVLRRSAPLHHHRLPLGRAIFRHESTAAKKSEIPSSPSSSSSSSSSSGSSPVGSLLLMTTVVAGTYVGGLFVSEKVPEVKKVYDAYLPYTKEAKQLIGLLPPDSKNQTKPASSSSSSPPASSSTSSSFSLSSVTSSIQDLIFGKPAEKPVDKKAAPVVPEAKKPSSDNAPFIPQEGVKVVIIDPSVEEKEKKPSSKQQEPEEDAASLKAPPMNSVPQFKEITGPLIGLEDDEEDITNLHKDIEIRNQVALTEVLEKSKQNLKQADDTINDLQGELEALLKKTDNILTSARTADVQDQISKLRSKLEELSAEKKVAEEKFKLELDNLQALLQNEAQARFEVLQQKHQKDLHEEANRHDKDLAQQYRNQENLYNLRVKEELQKQEQALEALFKDEIDLTLKKERAERMSKIERLAATAKVLEQVSRKQGNVEADNAAVRKVLLAITGFQDAIENKRPFEKELAYLKVVASTFPLIQQALDTIDTSLAAKGVSTPADLSTRFVNVRKAVSEAAYVSPTGGLWSVTLSWALSQFSLTQTGLVEGNDVGAILARSEHHLIRGDIESATREMNQLKGWQKKLAQDWIQASRHYLEVRQTLALVEAEISHQLLG